ncbi:hypothetical protein GCM10020358_62830 [Amorphoplanes nipponensis]|uniref:DUF4229 domain-containing protein n=1 Tax=Actinoplanes nipponensis TaxID=135950 RepID=A0A919JJP3_9ACTN|nr:DUF4229 domain-containing protein [Actinoplanes nipponensis]GIE52018.1 hypothetical protein Ani05nite_55520 [Actinoplanes nipponensis]
MSPAVKYTLGRFGLFVVVFVLLLPVPLAFLVKAMIALLASAGFSYFLLAKWRNEMAEQLGTVAERRKAEKERLRAALAGDEAAAAAGDRAAVTPPAASAGGRTLSTPEPGGTPAEAPGGTPAAGDGRAPARADKGDNAAS